MINCEFMNGRNQFMLLSRETFLEFSSLRRAAFSTLCLLCQITNAMHEYELFIHSIVCRDTECKLNLCKMMKNAVEHVFHCRGRLEGKCDVCKKIVSLCSKHSKYCNNENCTLLFCANIKEKVKNRKLKDR